MSESRSTPASEELDEDTETGHEARIRAITAKLDADCRAEFGRLCEVLGFPDTPPFAGKLIANRYVCGELIGAGGMGVVYLARDQSLDLPVAIKLVRASHLANSPASSDQLLQEAKRMVQLRRHANVVAVLDAGVHEDSTFLVMDYVAGHTLRAWLREASPSPARILDAYIEAARGLSAVHAFGLVHCDFKPDNVLIGADRVAKVTDFGVARLADPSLFETLGAGASHEPELVGTLSYIAPEQFDGRASDARADQFSFCVALWEALAGQLPYRWRGSESQRQALSEAPAGSDRLPRWLVPVLERGMAFDPAQRYPNMDALIAAIESGRRRLGKLLTGSLAVTVLTAAVGLGVWLGRADSIIAVSTCESFSGQVQQLWSEDRRAVIARRSEREQVDLGRGLEQIDDAVANWTRAAVASCEGEQAPAVDDPVRVCLERWAYNFDSILDLLEQGDELTFIGLPNLVASLPVPGGQSCVSILRASDPGLAKLVTEVEASWIDDPWRAERQSQAALVRAQELTAGRRYGLELALAYIARADALRGRRELAASADAFALAHEQTSALMDPGLTLLVRVMWARVLANMQTTEATAKAELLLDIAEPLLSVIDAGPNERMRAELLETRGQVACNLRDHEAARDAYRAATRMYKEQGELIYAARAVVGEGVVELDAHAYDRAEALLREAILMFEALGVPSAYPRLLQARFDLALVLFDYAYDPSSEDGAAQLAESLALLSSVADLARAPLRQKAIAAVCQIAAEAGEREILLRYLDEGRAALAVNERIADREQFEAQLALAALIGLQTTEAEDAVQALIFARPEPLEPSLRLDVALTWLIYLESKSCEEFERGLARVLEIDTIAADATSRSKLVESSECE